MALKGYEVQNVADVTAQTEPDGKVAAIGEVLSQTNELIADMPMVAGNAPMGNRVTVRSSLPTIRFAKINQGVKRSKSTTEQFTDSIGILSTRSEVDSRLKIAAGRNWDRVRWNEDQAFLEAFAQSAAYNVLYGDETTDESAFTGLHKRFSSLSGKYGSQIVDAGGTGADNTSIWIIDWHERYVHGIYPEGSRAGLDARDKGEERVTDEAGDPYDAWCYAYDWALGISVRDYRHIARIANIDASDLLTAGEAADTAPKLVNKLMWAFGRMQPANGASRRIYCNNTVWTALSIMAANKTNLALSLNEFAGQGLIPHFWGAPIRRVDQISNAEARIIA